MSLRDDLLMMTAAEREAWCLGMALAMSVPDSIRPNKVHPNNWPALVIKQGSDTLEIPLMPDLLSFSKEGFYLAIAPTTVQHIADAWGCMMVSRKLVRLATLSPDTQKVSLQIPGKPFIIPSPPGTPAKLSMVSTECMLAHSDMVHAVKRTGKKFFLGHGKTVTCGPKTTGKRLAIYGGAGGTVDGWCWQPYSIVVKVVDDVIVNEGPHADDYEDYSQGTSLVSRDWKLNGSGVDGYMIAQDPKYAPMVSDQGPFPWVWPNAAGGKVLGNPDLAKAGNGTSGGGGTPVRPPSFRSDPHTVAGLAVTTIGLGSALVQELFRRG